MSDLHCKPPDRRRPSIISALNHSKPMSRRLLPLNTRLGVTVMRKPKRRKEVSLDDLCRKRDKALERVVKLYLKDDYEEQEEDEMEKALDILTVAHIKATFEQFSGSFSS
jgi:hypothetical protein